MDVLLTAVSVRGSGERRRSVGVGGITLTSDPISTRKCVLVCASETKNKRLAIGPETPVAASVRPSRFPRCSGPGTSWQLRRTSYGTSRCTGVVRRWERGCEGDDLWRDCGCVEGGLWREKPLD